MVHTAQRYIVRAQWDSEAKVWFATSEDILGLVTEADTFEQLVQNVIHIAPELLAANGAGTDTPDTLPIHVMADRLELVETIR